LDSRGGLVLEEGREGRISGEEVGLSTSLVGGRREEMEPSLSGGTVGLADEERVKGVCVCCAEGREEDEEVLEARDGLVVNDGLLKERDRLMKLVIPRPSSESDSSSSSCWGYTCVSHTHV